MAFVIVPIITLLALLITLQRSAVTAFFMARIMFHSAEARRQALWIIIAVCLFIAACALVEVRLIPLVTARTLKSVGLFRGVSQMVLERWGLFRTQVLYNHPIDMG